MPVKQRAELVLKADAAMMRRLPSNVSLHRCALGLTDGEGSVSRLPLEDVGPLREASFTHSDEVRLSSLTQPASVMVRACRASR